MHIYAMAPKDWESVSKIYKAGINTGCATFEKKVPSYEDWDKAHISSCRIVIKENDKVIGWAALSTVSSRCVYGGVAEVSVYVGQDHSGKGAGKLLMMHLIAQSEKDGFWTLQSGIFPENEASIALHKKAGFRYIGKREKVGQLDGVWKDNLLFERRSKTIGIS
ncbi:GNAT family N-acetyltransferase [Maribacter sp. HTCC2170]|uniref:GNAT family N-acetyltransferase n=1 Tax=Maribacter sp. (strain HTCC2170 / KCCM 42371) TaxID=313603 RepID=UPI00006BD5DC|nr:GNAT family N-acetyltransferase [Maribacter sp. HTCC2170]EAR02469.1 phosphinothricin N-acetyltransferase [Maribacter sp. HTCC2170]